MSPLSEKLLKLGFKNATALPTGKTRHYRPLVELLAGRTISTSVGEVICLEKHFPYGYTHGDVTFLPSQTTKNISLLGKLINGTSIDKHLFIDTETTGLNGGTGTLPFLIGFGFFSECGFNLVQLIIENPAEEPAQLVEFINYSQYFENTITFNGKSFDLPILKTRFVINQLLNPLEHFEHLDLLHLSRKIWKMRLPNRSLKEIERQILLVPREESEVPGWMIPQIYFDFLKTGDGELLKNVVYHNSMDIVSLAALYIKITQIIDENHDPSDLDIADLFSIGIVYEQINEMEKALQIFLTCSSAGILSGEHLIKLNAKIANIYKKASNWNEAEKYWILNAKTNDSDSCIELAMYYEHNKRDYKSALEWTDKAESLLDTSTLPRYKKQKLIQEIFQRKRRLEKRI
jgi:uncharacterized protein YprB with RNaseH-like and TPR domain